MASTSSFVILLFCLAISTSARWTGYKKAREDTELSALFTRLWNGDTARARAAIPGGFQGDIVLDLGGKTLDNETVDRAPNPLFRYVNEHRLFSHPTTAAYLQLQDNYYARASRPEDQESNSKELQEINIFLDRVINTPTMQRAYQYLRDNQLLPEQSTFLAESETRSGSYPWKRLLRHIWFGLYSRHKGVLGSSGFEHVFLGEIDDGKVKGVHNWIWFYLMEKRGILNFQGHYNVPTTEPHLLSERFTWNFENHSYKKKKSSIIIGSTPEFDMAVFTVTFLKRPVGVTKFKINSKSYMIQCWNMSDGTIGSTFFLG